MTSVNNNAVATIEPRANTSMRSRITVDTTILIIEMAVICAASILFFECYLPYLKPYPYSDDWIFVQPFGFDSLGDWLRWLFMQHVDHRIPFQKLITFLTLRLSGFDFRYVVLVNYALAITMSLAAIQICVLHRGRRSLCDVLIPTLCLGYAAGPTQWGFQMQFMLATASLIWTTYFFFDCEVRPSVARLVLGFVSLTVCSLTGVNGLIASSCLSAGLLLWALLARRDSLGALKVGLGAIVVLDGVIWAMWTPTAASGGSIDISTLVTFVIGLLPSPMIVYSFHHPAWKAAIMLALLALAGACLVRDARSRAFGLRDALLALGICAAALIMMSVAFGRAKAQGGWSFGVALHYGFLLVPMPLLSWVVVSRKLPLYAETAVGVVLLILFARAFEINMDWRQEWVNGTKDHVEEMQKDFASSMDIAGLVDRNISDLYWISTDQAKADIVRDVNTLRNHGMMLYGPVTH